MNGPALEENVSKLPKDLNESGEDGTPAVETDKHELDFLDPSRWWIASTALPLAAGTFGPIANAFSICALVEPWREYIPDGSTEDLGIPIHDPAWLIGINAVSLVFALVANLALLLNMAKSLKFEIAQPVSIVGWFISGFLLIALVCVASSSSSGFRLDPPQNHALTEAFYYAIMAAALYCVVGIFMIVTLYGANTGHYPKQFRLTNSQRSLMLQTIMFLGYLLLGALVYKYIEGWKYLDAVYWADFTLLTIGLGSPLAPQTHLGRCLLFPYAVGGILTVGLVIGSIRTLVLERVKTRMEARVLEKRREASLHSLNEKKHTIKVSWFRKYKYSQDGLTEAQRREQEFYLMRKIQDEALKTQRWISLLTSSAATLALWLVGAAVFSVSEKPQGWTYFTAIYFSYTSLLAIGYGDFQPVSNSGKPFFVFWTLLAVPTLTILISHMGDTVVKGVSDITIWAASLTILPSDQGVRKRIKVFIRRVMKGGQLDSKELHFDRPPGFVPYSSDETEDKAETTSLDQRVLDRLATHVEEEEVEDAVEAGERGDKDARDLHLYHYVLVRELKSVAVIERKDPHRKYPYNEWAWYLKLLRQDEADPSNHRKAQAVQSKKTAINEWGNADNGEDSRKWSWLGIRSPLLSTKTESEWLMTRLTEQLESELRDLRRNKSQKSPVSLDDLVKRMRDADSRDKDSQKTKQGSSKTEADLERMQGLACDQE